MHRQLEGVTGEERAGARAEAGTGWPQLSRQHAGHSYSKGGGGAELLGPDAARTTSSLAQKGLQAKLLILFTISRVTLASQQILFISVHNSSQLHVD